MVDFASVNLRILSPDGKTVLGELKQIDATGQRAAGNATMIGANMRKSVSAARTLAFAASGVTSGLTGAVSAAGNLAESIALSSRNARVAAGAGGIGALVAVGVTLGVVWKNAQEQLKGFLSAQNELASQTKIAQLTGTGSAGDQAAKREQIVAAGAKELEQIRAMKLEEWQRNQLLTARQRLTQQQLQAFERETARAASDARRKTRLDAGGSLLDLLDSNRISRAGLAHASGSDAQAFEVGRATLSAEKTQRINTLQREMDDANERQAGSFTRNMFDDRFAAITEAFDLGVQELERDLADRAGQVGDSFVASLAGSISDGIATAISSGNIGDGFRALTGGILIGLGEMVQEIGTKSLLAAKLMTTIVSALRSFAPAGAIGPALALIALGGVLKGVGASMGGGGGRSFSGGSAGGGFSGGGTIVDRGLINPLNPAPNLAGLSAVQPININNPVFIGTDDPRVQRDVLSMVDKARARREG